MTYRKFGPAQEWSFLLGPHLQVSRFMMLSMFPMHVPRARCKCFYYSISYYTKKRVWFSSRTLTTQYFEKNRNYLLITGFVTTTTRRVPHVEQELLTLIYLSAPPVFSGFGVDRSLVFCVMFRRLLLVLLSFCTFSFGHCIIILRFTVSGYLFGTFKFFLASNSPGQMWCWWSLFSVSLHSLHYLYSLVLLPPKIIWLSNLLVLSVPDERYSRNASCALSLISTFLLHWIKSI